MYVAICDRMLALAFENPLAGLRALGLDAIELELSQDFSVEALDGRGAVSLAGEGAAASFRDELSGLGVRAACLMTACDLSVGTVEENIAWTVRALELGDALGVGCVRVDSFMKEGSSLSLEERVARFVTVMRGVVAATPDIETPMGIENHGAEGNDVAFLFRVIEGVDPSRLGMTLDTGNFYWRGYPLSEVYDILERLAPYAKHTHVKNIGYPEARRAVLRETGWEYKEHVCGLAEGDIDHGRVVRALHAVGYEGALCIENEALWGCASQSERAAMLTRDVAHVRALIEAL
jgi:sugar phosphate isomerase/epimerase